MNVVCAPASVAAIFWRPKLEKKAALITQQEVKKVAVRREHHRVDHAAKTNNER